MNFQTGYIYFHFYGCIDKSGNIWILKIMKNKMLNIKINYKEKKWVSVFKDHLYDSIVQDSFVILSLSLSLSLALMALYLDALRLGVLGDTDMSSYPRTISVQMVLINTSSPDNRKYSVTQHVTSVLEVHVYTIRTNMFSSIFLSAYWQKFKPHRRHMHLSSAVKVPFGCWLIL